MVSIYIYNYYSLKCLYMHTYNMKPPPPPPPTPSRVNRYSLPGSKGALSPRADRFPGLEMRARGAQAKKVPSQVNPIHTYMHTCIHTYLQKHMSGYKVNPSMFVCVCTHSLTHTHTQTYIYIRGNTYIADIHMYDRTSPSSKTGR